MMEEGKMIHDELFNIDFGLQDSFCDETDLKTLFEKVMMSDCLLASLLLCLTSWNQSYSDRALMT